MNKIISCFFSCFAITCLSQDISSLQQLCTNKLIIDLLQKETIKERYEEIKKWRSVLPESLVETKSADGQRYPDSLLSTLKKEYGWTKPKITTLTPIRIFGPPNNNKIIIWAERIFPTPDNSTIIAWTDRYIKICEGKTGVCRARINTPHDIERIKISNNNKFIIYWCSKWPGTSIASLASGEQILKLPRRPIKLSHQAHFCISCHNHNQADIHNIDSKQNIATLRTNFPIQKVKISPDDKKIVFLTTNLVEVWDLESKKNLYQFPFTQGKDVCAYQIHLKFSSDSNYLIVAQEKFTACKYDIKNGIYLGTLHDEEKITNNIIQSHDKNRFAFSCDSQNSKSIKIYDIVNDLFIAQIVTEEKIKKLLFSPDDTKILVHTERGVSIYHANTGRKIQEIEADWYVFNVQMLGNTHVIGYYNLSPFYKSTWKIWNIETGKCHYTFNALPYDAHLTICTSGKTIMTDNPLLKLYKPAKWQDLIETYQIKYSLLKRIALFIKTKINTINF